MNWIITYKDDDQPVYWIDNANFLDLVQQIPEEYRGGDYNVCPA